MYQIIRLIIISTIAQINMESQAYSIAILIPVYNRLEQTKECLNILESQKDTLFFSQNKICVIVTDDGSSDGTSDYIQVNHPEVIVLHGDGNLWWSGSMNIAAKHAINELKCDFVLLWENDITPYPDYFNNLQLILNNREEKHIICSKIYYQINSAKIFAMGGFFDPHTGRKKLHGRMEDDSDAYQNVIEVDWFCGQGILIPKSVFAKAGYFDEKVFPQYHGDADFALRAKKSGFINLVYPNLKITNDTTTTGISHVKNKTIRQFIESLFSIRSNANIMKNIRFYNRHTTGIRAYFPIIKSYFTYIGGYIKWRFLGIFGIHKKYTELY